MLSITWAPYKSLTTPPYSRPKPLKYKIPKDVPNQDPLA